MTKLTPHNFNTEGLSTEQKAELVDALYSHLNGLPVQCCPEVLFVLQKIVGKDTEQARLHKLVIQQWTDWRTNQTGVKPVTLGKHAAAAKQIAAYLLSLKRDTGKPPENVLPFVFANWDKIDPFLRGQTDLNQILSNLNNILNQLRNGQPSRKKQRPTDSDLERAIQERFNNGTP